MMLRISICRVGFWLSARLHGPPKPGTYPLLRYVTALRWLPDETRGISAPIPENSAVIVA